jgi:DNA-binding SARP family transcriptional activator/basic membrane lipoprotein Med (substrate-binding protein (PBP1-ABC) superfamily)
VTVFRILGPLEVRENAQGVDVGGRKQRVLLAVLLLHAGETVSVDQLIEALWGDKPPPRAVSSVHAYVSRLRKVLGRDRIVRSDYGYRVLLGRDELDLRRFEQLLAHGRELLQQGDAEQARETLGSALGLWQGPPLADFMYEPFAAAEIRRLEELRLDALEERLEADLALGHHAELVPEIDAVVRAHPLRERLVGQLMVALYRAGRQAEALDVYERTRRELGHELGLQPSHELQHLSAEIVRQEPSLDALAATTTARPSVRETVHRRSALALVALALVVAVGATIVFVGADGGPSATAAPRMALVLPRPPGPRPADAYVAAYMKGLRLAASEEGFQTRWLVGDELPPLNSPTNAKLRAQVQTGDFDLVVVAGETLAAALVPTVRELESTRFVFVDVSLDRIFNGRKPFHGLRNATGVTFADEQAGYLVGYLSGLIEARGGTRLNHHTVVSAIGGFAIPSVKALVNGFARGARQALPGITVRTDYSKNFVDESKCADLANRQIDDGSDIVFAAAGKCSFGALRMAGTRGVWGIGVDGDRSNLGPHILASTVTRFDQAVLVSARSFMQGTLPAGRDVVLGLDDDVVGITGISPQVPASIRKRIARAEAALGKDAER